MSLNNAHEGYDYQDLITSYFILEEILNGNRESIFSIDKKHTKGDIPDRFDDLVITNGDRIQRKQVKYSNEETSVRLIKNYLSADSHYKIALHKLYESWKELNTPHTEFRLCLSWNEPVEEDILKVLDLQPSNLSSFESFSTKVFKININQLWEIKPEKFNGWNSLRKYVKKNNIDRDEFKKFCECLLIEVNLPKASLQFNSPNELEEILISQAARLGIGQYPNDDINIIDFLVKIVKYVGGYRTSSAVVTAENVLKELRIKTDFGKLQQKFEVDQNKNVKSDCRYSLFYEYAVTNKKIILTGEPGAGKSWYLTNLIDYLERNEVTVLRHYCFTSTEDEFIEKRVNFNTFFGNLISDIEKSFPTLTKVKKQVFAANLDELNILLKKIEEPLVIVVDGLDHINRVLNSSAALSKEKTQILECISQINAPDNVTIVLGSQPVDELNFLKENFGYKEHQLPAWNIQDTKELVKKHGINKVDCDDEVIITLIHEKSEGNPLYLTYILLTLESCEVVSNDLIHYLPPYDFNLKKYYEYLTNRIENNTTAEILSCLDFSVTRKELKEIIPVKHYFDSSMKVLSPVITENAARGGVRLYHDSFRRFNMEKLADEDALDNMYEFIINWLNRGCFFESEKSYRYLFGYLIRAKKYGEISCYAVNDFLPNSLYYAHSETLIRKNYESFLSVAKKTQNWPLFVFASELNRAINTTSSEEYQSQFLDNFELYFEAVCLIYGVDKANALLYFNGEKNHNDSITAQAFSILEKHGYCPSWSDVHELFSDSVKQDDFQHYIRFFNQTNGDFLALLKKIMQHDDKTYLKIFVDEVFKLKDSDYLVDLYNELTIDEKESIGDVINTLFEREECAARVSVKPEECNVTLEPLSLLLTGETAERDELAKFCRQLKLYSENDLESLINFGKTMPSGLIVHSWIKFFIRNLILDKTCHGSSLEKGIIQSFEKLADDINNFPKSTHTRFFFDKRGLIDRSFEQALQHINSQVAWKNIFAITREIGFPIIPTIEKRFLNEITINLLIDAYDNFDEEDCEYFEQSENSFKKAIYRAKIGCVESAKLELKNAVRLTTSYTSRKDRNLSEVIEPLPSVAKVSPSFAKEYTKKLKYLTDAVMKHTEDGKDTRWLTIEWFEVFVKIDSELAMKYLINEMITNGYFWKLDFMFVELLQHAGKVKPCILNFLYKLSPTNTKDMYLNNFLNVIEILRKSDGNLAKRSIINLSARDWNKSYNILNQLTLRKYHSVARKLALNLRIEENDKNNSSRPLPINDDNIYKLQTESLLKGESLRGKSTSELIEFLVSQDYLGYDKLNYLNFFFKEEDNAKLANEVLLPLIRKTFPRGNDYFTNLTSLIQGIKLSDEDKVMLLVNNFVYSKDGWFSCFVEKESLLQAVKIDRDIAQSCLASALYTFSKSKDFSFKRTANLIIAFQYVGFAKDNILSMYKIGFDFIESRLPHESEFEWESLNYIEISEMSDDERAITLLLSKANNLDSSVQREIVYAINYLLKNDADLLVKPLSWFFNNFHLFHQSTIASILELFSIEINQIKPFLLVIKPSIERLLVLKNLYIQNEVENIFCELGNE